MEEKVGIKMDELSKLLQIRACADSVSFWNESYKKDQTQTSKNMLNFAIERLTEYTDEYNKGIYTT